MGVMDPISEAQGAAPRQRACVIYCMLENKVYCTSESHEAHYIAEIYDHTLRQTVSRLEQAAGELWTARDEISYAAKRTCVLLVKPALPRNSFVSSLSA